MDCFSCRSNGTNEQAWSKGQVVHLGQEPVLWKIGSCARSQVSLLHTEEKEPEKRFCFNVFFRNELAQREREKLRLEAPIFRQDRVHWRNYVGSLSRDERGRPFYKR